MYDENTRIQTSSRVESKKKFLSVVDMAESDVTVDQ